MKQKTGRKLLSFLLTLAMVVGLVPGMGLTAEAATIQYDDYLVEVTNHNQTFIDAGICDQTTGLKCKSLSEETAKALENYLKSKTGSKVAVIYGCTVRSDHPGWSRISFVIDGTTNDSYYMYASIANAISNRNARNEAEYKLFYVKTDAPDFETANETVTFKVINGQWDDGTTEDVTVSLSGLKDEIRLAADQIPAVGTKPNDTYKAGSWDVTPSTDTAITEATTYTYTYVQKSSITPTVSIEGWTYGEAAKAPSVNGNTGNGTVTYTYAKKGTTDFSSTVPSAAGEYTVKAVIAETDDYLSAEATADFTIAKANATVSVPTPKTLTYNGYAQELVNEGSATGGTMKYAVTTENKAPTDENLYTTSIPTGKEAGTYYVWYKVVGNENYNDSKPDVVTVTIKSSVTITFDSNGGSEVDPQVIDKGGKAEEPEEPTNGKLAFIGWFIDPTMENLYDLDNDKINSFDFSSDIEKDTKLTAVWTAFARVNTIGTGKVNYAYEGEEKDDEYDDSIILSAIQGMADTFILTAKADEGSRFVKWQKVIEEGETVEDSTFEDYSEDEEITIKITEPISLVAVFETIDEDDKVYSSYESDTEWTKGSGKSLKVGAKGSKDDDETINHFMGLKCNGKVIAEKYYTAKKGSVKIEIDPEYLETLEVGKHVLTVMFDDADDVEITFTVLAAKEETSKDAKVDVDDKSKATNDASTDKATESKTDKVANTGDNAQPLLALFVMIDAALALNYVLLRKRRDKRNN